MLGFSCQAKAQSINHRGPLMGMKLQVQCVCILLQVTHSNRTMEYFCPILMLLPSIRCENQHKNGFPVVNSMKAAIMFCPRLHSFSFVLGLIIWGSWTCLAVDISSNLCLYYSCLVCVVFLLTYMYRHLFFSENRPWVKISLCTCQPCSSLQ